MKREVADQVAVEEQQQRPNWAVRLLGVVWLLALSVVWLFSTVFVGLYLLVRRIFRPSEKWPVDDGK